MKRAKTCRWGGSGGLGGSWNCPVQEGCAHPLQCPSPRTHLRERWDASAVSEVTIGQSAAPMIMQWPEGLPAGGGTGHGSGNGSLQPFPVDPSV